MEAITVTRYAGRLSPEGYRFDTFFRELSKVEEEKEAISLIEKFVKKCTDWEFFELDDYKLVYDFLKVEDYSRALLYWKELDVDYFRGRLQRGKDKYEQDRCYTGPCDIKVLNLFDKLIKNWKQIAEFIKSLS